MTIRLGIIGGGVMGEAILSGVLSKGVYSAQEICVSDPQPDRRNYIAKQYGVRVTDVNALASVGEVAILAVKPQICAQAVEGLSSTSVPLVISILAGVTLAQLESAIISKAIIRAMPNTPAQVGAGVTALAMGASADRSHREIAIAIFSAIGEVVELPESLMNAVTGLSGSGPGYVSIVIEALADGGVAAGLPRAIATKLAIQTVLGTAQLISTSGLHPAELKDRVTSPGGTTIAGIAQLERSGVRSGLIDAVVAATRRAEELGKS
ncbi:pyrroline-5-carboxylate reductase [Pseudanabaena sp. PCC 6802]|uniref:pyrroline-5-carboxylate reductase n=1 Tax=Pseudanabaena sp. PCC 6802 TaxID=118173 RepID=UPI000345D70B|nr:pyrroline-5-carboxylate reductase [Pseudanabaena sp. PCC 6802]